LERKSRRMKKPPAVSPVPDSRPESASPAIDPSVAVAWMIHEAEMLRIQGEMVAPHLSQEADAAIQDLSPLGR
jgi:hypothetical protein